jgi:hypothetical protein
VETMTFLACGILRSMERLWHKMLKLEHSNVVIAVYIQESLHMHIDALILPSPGDSQAFRCSSQFLKILLAILLVGEFGPHVVRIRTPTSFQIEHA